MKGRRGGGGEEGRGKRMGGGGEGEEEVRRGRD